MNDVGKVILIVEDDPKTIKLIRDLLQISRYKTLEATDGKQAIDLAREKMPDLILMDIQMPVMDGLEATKILKTDPATKSIPVIALTASAMPEDHNKFMKTGGDAFITKPVDTRAFLATVKEYLEK
jgi:Response regulators consisting of a CheY-like receiver domain and a winged-helix DNA-binding domain